MFDQWRNKMLLVALVMAALDFAAPVMAQEEPAETPPVDDIVAEDVLDDDADAQKSFAAEIVGQFDPPAFDAGCVNAVRNAAERLGYSHMDIVSGAGHDACWINDVAPTAMVMCPCVDGLSHNEAEEISKEWATAGADVLFHAVVETAEIVE